MTKQIINIGTSANKGNGDPLRTAFTKVNANFDDLYAEIGTGVTASATAPVGPVVGDLWYDTNSGRTYIYYDSSWIDASPVDGAGISSTNELVNGAHTVSLGTDGGLTFPDASVQTTAYPGIFTGYDYEIHVSQTDGDDTTGNGDLLKPVASITKALTLVTGERRTVIIHPGTYTESPTITGQFTVLTTLATVGGSTLISGTVTATTGCTISGLKITNLTSTAASGTGNVNILNCDISGTLTKSGSGLYTLVRFTDCGAATISGSGLVDVYGGTTTFVTVNNAAANVLIKNGTTVAPVVTAGSLSIVQMVVVAAVTNAVTTSAGTVITIANCQIVNSALNNVAPVVLNGFYSIINCVYDKPGSTLVALSATGGSTSSVDYFQYINADRLILASGGQITFPNATVQTTAWTGSVSSLVNGAHTLSLGSDSAVTLPNYNTGVGSKIKSAVDIKIQAGAYYLSNLGILYSDFFTIVFSISSAPNWATVVAVGDYVISGTCVRQITAVTAPDAGEWRVNVDIDDFTGAGDPSSWSFYKPGATNSIWTFGADGELSLPTNAYTEAVIKELDATALVLFAQSAGGNIKLLAGATSAAGANQWLFNGTDGSLTLPTGGTVSYTPTTATDWNGTAPTTMQAAIDRLAAAFKILNSGTGA